MALFPKLIPADANPSDDAAEVLRPPGRLVWFHTGQGGATPAVNSLVRRLAAQEPGLSVLLTGAQDAFGKGEPEFPRVTAPPDRPGPARAFLDRWRPDLGVWTECDLRPALTTAAADARIPLLMADAGTARPDPRPWRWRPRQARTLLGHFRRILAADQASAADLRRMGADPGRLSVAGVIEEGPPALPCNARELDALADLFAGRPVWLAAGIAGAEETDAAIAAHRRAVQRAHRLLMILVPETRGEGPSIAQRLTEDGWSIAVRSAGEEPARDTQIYVADTDGEMGLWYRLSPISFLGQSLGSGPGRDPYEAAALGSAILHGPNVRDHRDAYARLAAAGATRVVRTADELAATLEETLAPDVAASMAQEGWRVCSAGAEVTDRLIALILETLDEGRAA